KAIQRGNANVDPGRFPEALRSPQRSRLCNRGRPSDPHQYSISRLARNIRKPLRDGCRCGEPLEKSGGSCHFHLFEERLCGVLPTDMQDLPLLARGLNLGSSHVRAWEMVVDRGYGLRDGLTPVAAESPRHRPFRTASAAFEIGLKPMPFEDW